MVPAASCYWRQPAALSTSACQPPASAVCVPCVHLSTLTVLPLAAGSVSYLLPDPVAASHHRPEGLHRRVSPCMTPPESDLEATWQWQWPGGTVAAWQAANNSLLERHDELVWLVWPGPAIQPEDCQALPSTDHFTLSCHWRLMCARCLRPADVEPLEDMVSSALAAG